MKKLIIKESQLNRIKNLITEATIEDFQSVDIVTIADPRISIAYGMMFNDNMSQGILSYEVLNQIFKKYPAYISEDGNIYSESVEGSKKIESKDVFVMDAGKNVSVLNTNLKGGSIWKTGELVTNFVEGFGDLLSLSKFIYNADDTNYEDLLFGDLEDSMLNIWDDNKLNDVEKYLILPASKLPIARLKEDFVKKLDNATNIWFKSIVDRLVDYTITKKNYNDYYDLVMKLSKHKPQYEVKATYTNTGQVKWLCCDKSDKAKELCDLAAKQNPAFCKKKTNCIRGCYVEKSALKSAGLL